jgi:hypothetical protein
VNTEQCQSTLIFWLIPTSRLTERRYRNPKPYSPLPRVDTVAGLLRRWDPFRGPQSMLDAVWSTRVWREGTIHIITRSLTMLSGG